MNAGQNDLLETDCLVERLQSQVESARRSDFRSLERQVRHTGQMVRELTDSGQWAQMNEDKRRHVTALYRELVLMLTGAKDQVDRQVRQTKQVRRTLDAYRLQG